MNDSRLKEEGSRCYEKLKGVDDMNESGLSAKGSICYEQLRVVDDMNDSRSWD